jgi:hypothetical protein
MIQERNLCILATSYFDVYEYCLEETYDAVVGAALTPKIQRMVVIDTFVDDAIGKHRLGGDAKNEHTEREIIRRT